MWTVRIIQSSKINIHNEMQPCPPRLTKVNIVRLEDFASSVDATGIDKRCIKIIELEQDID